MITNGRWRVQGGRIKAVSWRSRDTRRRMMKQVDRLLSRHTIRHLKSVREIFLGFHWMSSIVSDHSDNSAHKSDNSAHNPYLDQIIGSDWSEGRLYEREFEITNENLKCVIVLYTLFFTEQSCLIEGRSMCHRYVLQVNLLASWKNRKNRLHYSIRNFFSFWFSICWMRS